MGRRLMTKRMAVAILGIFLLSLAPTGGIDVGTTGDSAEILDPVVTRIGIAPDPDSIQGLGEPQVLEGFERTRENTAESTIGVYTELGLIPSVHLPRALAEPRGDLAMVIVHVDVCILYARIPVE